MKRLIFTGFAVLFVIAITLHDERIIRREAEAGDPI